MNEIECKCCGSLNQADTLFCIGCGRRIQEDQKFATSFSAGTKQECLTSQNNICPSCGEALSDDSVFCDACGARVMIKHRNPPPVNPPLPEETPTAEPTGDETHVSAASAYEAPESAIPSHSSEKSATSEFSPDSNSRLVINMRGNANNHLKKQNDKFTPLSGFDD